ncbi:MAG TPA: hypothetical protein VMM15_43805 [Bradyrhizobium sp.]|nr:hypothetical protein [Bradyrhizobium sp.]
MRSSALVPLIVLSAAYAAQAAGGPPSGPPVTHFQGSCESDPDGTKFAAKACYTVYYPGKSGFGAAYHPPTCAKKTKVTDGQRQILARIYTRAPDYMKAKLCRLTQLFVTRAEPWGPWGWGFWEGPDRPPGKAVYVAIADRELDSKKSLADAENQTAEQLLGAAERRRSYGPKLQRLRTTDPSDPELAVLGEIAHELGHALLADADADGTDPRHPRRKVSGPPRSACFENAFLGASWDPDAFHRRMLRWVDFGEQYQNRQKNVDAEFSLARLKAAARGGKLDPANDAISGVFRSKEFVSFGAAINPVEDFVETYKYKVLVDASPKSPVVFRLRNQDIDVTDLLRSGTLEKKVECLRDLGLLEGAP